MSSSKLGKIISEQTNNLLEQKHRIKQIYSTGNGILIASAGNIKVTDEFPSIKNKIPNHAHKALKDDSNTSKRYSQMQHRTNDSAHNTEEWKGNQTNDQLSNSDIMHKIPEGLMSTDVGRREDVEVDDFRRIARNESTSHSLLGNLSGNQHKLKKKLSNDNSTVPIKYNTTAVISEEYSNFEDPFTQMYTNSILSGWKLERNIEEMHYLHVNLLLNIRKMLEKTELKDDQPDRPEAKPVEKDMNLLEIFSDDSLEL
jgi:hypothetical protein